MSLLETGFWPGYESNLPRPLETAVSKTSPEMAVEFIRGGVEIYSAVALVNPDVLFLPERGAGPFSWMIEFLEDREGRAFYKVPLMIGTQTEVVSSESHGQTKPVKRMNVKRGLEVARDQLGSIKKPMLIDEVHFGGTIKIAANYLHLGLKEMGIEAPIYLVAAQNTTNSENRKKVKGYKTLISNTKPGIRAAVVDIPLIFMDNQIFLNHELVDNADNLPMPMLFHNTDAEEFVKNLTLSYINPAALVEALSAMDTGSIPVTEDGKRLYAWISQFIVGLDETSWVSIEDAKRWLREFHLHSAVKSPSDITVLVR